MKNRLAWMFASVVSFAIPSNGCRITTCEHGSVCGLEDEQAREDACRSLCDRLVVCGNVAGGDHDACMSTCYDEYDRSPSSTSNGCRCASRASCSEIADRQCPGAPPIGGGYGTGSGSTTVTGGGSVTVGATTGGSVTVGATTSGSGSGGATSGATTSGATTGSGGAPGYDAGSNGGSAGAPEAGPGCGHD